MKSTLCVVIKAQWVFPPKRKIDSRRKYKHCLSMELFYCASISINLATYRGTTKMYDSLPTGVIVTFVIERIAQSKISWGATVSCLSAERCQETTLPPDLLDSLAHSFRALSKAKAIVAIKQLSLIALFSLVQGKYNGRILLLSIIMMVLFVDLAFAIWPTVLRPIRANLLQF